ncbi:unnamed protein product, partial [Adineta ricciae]
MQLAIVIFLLVSYSYPALSSIENYAACKKNPLTYDTIENHLSSISNLYFLFGIRIHRPFMNVHSQTHAEASMFILAICKKYSSDCISQGGSLPSNYKLEFTLNGAPYTDRHTKIDRQWHRLKIANYDFLYDPFHSHSWYDHAENDNDSIWKKFIMNMDSNENENIHAKWVEFGVKINDAGAQFIEGQQRYNNISVQQFQLHFFVPTYECLQAPILYFDDLAAGQQYLSAFHFQLHSDQCYLHKYTCHLRMRQVHLNNVGGIHNTFNLSGSINITTNHLSLFTQRISNEQAIQTTNFIDHISEQVMTENSTLLYDTEIYRNAMCINKNPITAREFLLCTEDYIKNELVIRTYRIDIILCQPVKHNAEQCLFSLYRHIFNGTSRLFIPVKNDNITYIGFIRLPEDLPNTEWRNHLNKTFDKLYNHQLKNVYDHTIEIKTNVDSMTTLLRSYQIITDQTDLCHLVCHNHCVQQSPKHSDYIASSSTIDLILFCNNCSFNQTYSHFDHSIVYNFTILSTAIAVMQIKLTQPNLNLSVNCISHKHEIFTLNAHFHHSQQNTNYRPFSCSISPVAFYPYHDEATLTCENFTTPADIILWAITNQNGELIRTLLNPFYLTNQNFNSKIRIKINGLPHGDIVALEISSSLFSIIDTYELTVLSLDDTLITKINIALESNYFLSAFRLLNQYLTIYENEFYLLNQSNTSRLQLIGLNQTSFAMSILNYYRSILNYIDRESLHIKAMDFSQKICSLISTHLFKYKIFYPKPGNIYLNPFISLLTQLSSHPKIVTYQTYHLLRHTMKLISYSLPDTSLTFLNKLFDLCITLRIYVNHPKSLPISTITDANSLFELNQIVNQILVMIHHEFAINRYSDDRMQYINEGPIDFFINMPIPFITNRWALIFNRSEPDDGAGKSFSGIVYYPQEYIPIYYKTPTTISIDYPIGQIFSIEYSNSTLLNRSSQISFSLEHDYMDPKNLLQQYFMKISLERIGNKHYSHKFTFQTNTTRLARNISFIFLDLPNSPNYLFTFDITYNKSCSKRDKTLNYSVQIDLRRKNHFVYSIPVQSEVNICGYVEITSKHQLIRNLKRTGRFLVVETGCYSFTKNIHEDYYSELQTETCQLINGLEDDILSGAHLTCHCRPFIKKYLLLCQPKSILVQFEVNAQTWLHFYIYLSLLLLLFLLLGLYAIYKDTSDDYKPCVNFVADNQIGAVNVHLYQLTVFTGLQQSTTKDFRIYIRLIGEKCHDISHCLNSNSPTLFQRGSVDQFLLTSFTDIGRVIAINMWHDEIDNQCDFYIRHCILYDYHNHRTYYFCCYTWLSLRKGFNTINEVFYVAQEVDQFALGHLFLSTYAWCYYHYHLLSSLFNKQKMNTLTRIYRLHLYFCVLILQLYLIQLIIITCRRMVGQQRCAYVLPTFLFFVDQSFVASGWSEIFQIIRLNFFSSLFIALIISLITAFLTPILLWGLTLLTNQLDLYQQLFNIAPHYSHSGNLYSTVQAIASCIFDWNSYRRDVEQYQYLHKFDLQHRLSISTIGESEQKVSSSDTSIERNNNAANDDKSHRISQRERVIDDDRHSSSTDSSQSSIQMLNIVIPTVKVKVNWPKMPSPPSPRMYRFYLSLYYGLLLTFILISIVCMYATMRTFAGIENYFLTSTIIFIHVLSIVITFVFELIVIVCISLLNAIVFGLTDENKFISPIMEIPIASTNDIQEETLSSTFTLNRDITLTDVQLRERIRERFLESSIMRAVRDVIGYVVFMIIIIMVFAERSRNVKTRLTMRQYTLQLLLREEIFQNIDYIPDTMTWIDNLIEKRLFLQHIDYSCQKETCNYAQIPDSPLYLSKSIRVRQIRVERKTCHSKIQKFFHPLLPPSCSVDGDSLKNDELYVLHDQRTCSGWNTSSPNDICADSCNYTSIWSALATKQTMKFYKTHDSPWYFLLHLSPKEAIERCDRKRKYYDLDKSTTEFPAGTSFILLDLDHWLDDKTVVVIIEGNLYSPQTSSMISFVFTIDKNEYGVVDKQIFIEVSDYILTTTTANEYTEKQNYTSEATHETDSQLDITHYLFALLLCFIFTTKLFGAAKFIRNFGLYGLVFFLRTLSNIIDGILLLLCCYYFLLIYFDYKVLQLNNLVQSLNIH